MPDLAGQKVAHFGFTGPVDSNNVTRVCQALNLACNKGYDSVYLCISSPGGYVADGFYLYNHMRGLPIPITTHNTGTVASMGTLIYLAGDTRICSAHSMVMMHPTSLPADPSGMNWERLDASLRAAIADEDRLDAVIKDRTAVTDDILQRRRVAEVHLKPHQAVQLGLAHSIAEFAPPKGVEVIQI